MTERSWWILQTLVLLGFGVAYIILIRPMDAPDEPAHFMRAHGVLEGQLILHDHPKDVSREVLEQLEILYPEYKVPLVQGMRQLVEKHENRVPTLAFNTLLYPPVPYMLHAGAMGVHMLLAPSRPGALDLLTTGRIVTLLFFWLTVSWSLYRLGDASWPLFWLAATPMCLSQAAVVNLDGLLFGATAMLMALLISSKDEVGCAKWILVPAMVCMVLTKSPYAPLFLLPAFMVVFVFKELRPQFIIGLVLSFGFAGIWQAAMTSSGVVDQSMSILHRFRSMDIDPAAQLRFVLNSPAAFFSALAQSVSQEWLRYLHQFVGVLGWQTFPLPLWTVWAWLGGAVVSISSSRKRLSLAGPLGAAWLGVLCVSIGLSFLGVITSLYLFWMPVASNVIEMQGRYFHPFALVFLLGLVPIVPAMRQRSVQSFLRIGILFGACLFNAIAVKALLA